MEDLLSKMDTSRGAVVGMDRAVPVKSKRPRKQFSSSLPVISSTIAVNWQSGLLLQSTLHAVNLSPAVVPVTT